ncbi:MAG: D-alanyl-D-alanine carboxypeptidase [Streptosporangiaceae bacterium]
MTERIRTALSRGAALLAACSVTGAVALSSPAQAQPATGPAGPATPASGPAASAQAHPAAPGSGTQSPQQQAAATALLRQASTGGPPGNPATVGGAQLAGSGVVVNAPAAPLPTVPASAYVIADAGTGQVLAAKDPHGLLRPASTLKMLTAVTLIPLLNPDATVAASEQATTVTPNVAGLVRGQPYQVSDLFYALLMISANDAAIALAQATGSLGNGVALMNAEAHHLQAYDVTAKDPNGLDAPGQHVSAYDLALIARQALTMPELMNYDATREISFPVTARKSETLFNQNDLLTKYPGGIGGKIGWTSAAGATYIGMARRNGVTLIVTVLHCQALTEVINASKLLNWGFAEDGKVRPVGRLVSPITAGGRPPARASGKPAPSQRPATSGDLTTTKIPGAPAAASIGLIVLAAAAAIVLILLRRRSPLR